MQQGRPLKIVMSVAYADPRWGGHEVFLCRALAQRGNEVTLVTSTMSPPRYGRHDLIPGHEEVFGFRIVRLPPGPSALEAPLIPGMQALLHSLRADVYHAHESFQPATLWTALASQRTGRPFILTQHVTGSFGRWWAPLLYHLHLRSWGWWILRQATAVIALTASAARPLSPFISRERLHIIPSGVDRALFAPDGPIDDRVAALARPVILYAGRLAPNKDVPTLIRALALLGKGSLVIAGSGSDHVEVHRLCQQLLGAERYRIIEPIPHQDMPRLYRAADLFVLPSRVEPFGLVVLEAMSCGTPAIAAAAEGPASFLPERLLFPPGDAAALASRIDDVLSRLNDERELALRLAADYSWERIAGQVEHVYRAALARACWDTAGARQAG